MFISSMILHNFVVSKRYRRKIFDRLSCSGKACVDENPPSLDDVFIHILMEETCSNLPWRDLVPFLPFLL